MESNNLDGSDHPSPTLSLGSTLNSQMTTGGPPSNEKDRRASDPSVEEAKVEVETLDLGE